MSCTTPSISYAKLMDWRYAKCYHICSVCTCLSKGIGMIEQTTHLIILDVHIIGWQTCTIDPFVIINIVKCVVCGCYVCWFDTHLKPLDKLWNDPSGTTKFWTVMTLLINIGHFNILFSTCLPHFYYYAFFYTRGGALFLWTNLPSKYVSIGTGVGTRYAKISPPP